jgi:hypothetical protein
MLYFVQAAGKDRYMTINSDIESMRKFLRSEKRDGSSGEVAPILSAAYLAWRFTPGCRLYPKAPDFYEEIASN